MSLKEDDKGIRYNRPKPQVRKKLEEKYGKKIRISRHDWELIFCERLIFEDEQHLGLCDPERRRLYVDVNHDNMESTLLHEILHAELSASGIRQRKDWCMNMEEQIVELVAEATTHLFLLRRKTLL